MENIFSLLPFALILSAGIFVQSAAGFAAGLMIIPALLWFGYSIPAAQCSLLVATIPQNIWGVWSFRDGVTPRQVVWPGIGRLICFPIGAWVLQSIESLQIDTIRQFVGGVVLVSSAEVYGSHYCNPGLIAEREKITLKKPNSIAERWIRSVRNESLDHRRGWYNNCG